MNWSVRAADTEMLDQPGIPFEAIRQNMQELAVINRWLGGHRISIGACKALVAGRRSFSIVEIGSGGGDNLDAIARWAARQQKQMKGSGIDINPECVQYAAGRFPAFGFIHADYRDAAFNQQPDIIFSSLFCHHFSSEDLVTQLRWMYRQCRVGFFINDLHRHPVAYHSIKWLTRFFSRSALVRNDAPISVRRGFSRRDWMQIISQAGIPEVSVSWKWAFRWCIMVKKSGGGEQH
ncbi:MAG: methyltransferase domain-containing protein [Flavihumibacter sp.]